MANPTIEDVFCLYLWRSVDAPGTLYLARGIQSARAVCAELIAAGYIVRVVQMVTNVEYELQEGALVASGAGGSEQPPPRSQRASQPVA